jgi:hypothetical protein
MAREHVANDSHWDQILTKIRQAGERARELVEQILVFGQRRDVNRSVMHVQALMGETMALLRAFLPPSLDLTLRQLSEPAMVSGV